MRILGQFFAIGLLSILLITLVFCFIGLTTGVAMMISSWYADRTITQDVTTLQNMDKNYFSEKNVFIQTTSNLNQTGDSYSGLYAMGLILSLITGGIGIFVFFVLHRFRHGYEWISGNKLRLKLTPTSTTVVFSMMFAISLIFTSSISFIQISKEQIMISILTDLISSSQSLLIIDLLEHTLISNYSEVFSNSFNAVYFGFVGFTFLLARILQMVNNEKAHFVTEAIIFSNVFCLILWIVAFVTIIGIAPSPVSSNPITPIITNT